MDAESPESQPQTEQTSREERLRIVEALMPGFWAVARPGSSVSNLLREVDRYVAGGPGTA